VAAQGRTLAGFNPADVGLGVVEGVETTAYLVDPLTEGDVEEFEARSAALGAAGLAAGSAAVTSAQENPGRALETVGAIGSGGYLGGRALSAAPSAVRTARVRARASDRVDLEEITDERGVEGDLPNFETDPNAPTSEAVEEIRTRAADNPEDVTDVLGTDRALFQSTEADLGPQFSARRGSSELPGLFTSPDASPLRLSGSGATSGGFSPRLIRLSDLRGPRDRFAAFEGDRIEGFPEDATGSGRIPDGADGYEPDPSTSGAQFLDDQADEGTAFVRPQGGRTTELEAIFPPGSTFRQSDTLAVDLPSGRSVPLDVFLRADADDVLAGARADDIGDGLGGGASTADDIAASLRRSSRRDRADGDPLAPTSGGFSSSGSTGLSAGSFGTGLSSSVFGTSSGSGFGSGGSSGFGSGSGFGSSGGSFFGSSSTPGGSFSGGSSTPFGDPTGVFGGGSSTPFGDPTGGSGSSTGPPSSPPGSPPSSPPGQPPNPPVDELDMEAEQLFATDATEDLFDSGIQSGDELLEDFGL
jgi:hypothetical protein